MLEHLKRAVKLPYTICREGLHGVYENFMDMPGKKEFADCREKVKHCDLKSIAGNVAGIYAQFVPHELLHLLGDYVSNGEYGRVYIPKIFGGQVFEKISSIFTSTANNEFSNLAWSSLTPAYSPSKVNLLTTLMPYAILPLYVYLLKDGVKNNRPFEAGFGTVGLLTNLGGLVGDYLVASSIIMEKVGYPLESNLEYVNPLSITAEYAVQGLFALLICGLAYKGSKMLVENLPKARRFFGGGRLEKELFDVQ